MWSYVHSEINLCAFSAVRGLILINDQDTDSGHCPRAITNLDIDEADYITTNKGRHYSITMQIPTFKNACICNAFT